MIRNYISICLCMIGVICSMPLYADEDCDMALKDAKTAYNAGEYTKAKKLYDYVASICGPTYGNASSLSQKCQDALTPKLSVSRSNISVNAYSGTTSITVTSNRTWQLANTSSSLYTVSRNGDIISISYSANPNMTSRSDYFDVVTTDGSKSVRVYISQEAKANTTPYLSVDKTSISASGTTEYITVSSNTTWEIQYPSATMYSVTRNGNSLTVKINANTSTDSRSDYFNVKTTDGSKVQKITLSQSGKSSSSPSSSYGSYATINNVTVDHNVYQNGYKGMKIHVKFSAYSVYNHTINVCVYFNYENGNALNGILHSNYVTSDGKATVQLTDVATYTNTTWNDFTLFMPYTNLNMQSGCKNVFLEGQVGVYDVTDHKWLTSDYKKFTFNFSN